jgi:hypothetical protein
MAIGNITDGEDGGDVRTKLNLSIDQLNLYTGGQATFTGAGATGTTTTALFKNSVGEESLVILNNGTMYNLGNGSIATNLTYGNGALANNTTGFFITALGYQALLNNTTGLGLTAVGYQVLRGNVDGFDNTGVGRESLLSNIDGNANTAVGRDSLKLNIDGSSLTSIGAFSLDSNTSGSFSTGLGRESLSNSTTPDSNTGVGYRSGFTNITGSNSVYLGANSGFYETGSNKLFIDNATRINEADGRLKAMIYGEFSANMQDQILTINGVAKLQPMTHTIAGSITATNGMLIYVSSTDATFTSVGIWAYEGGAWTKL